MVTGSNEKNCLHQVNHISGMEPTRRGLQTLQQHQVCAEYKEQELNRSKCVSSQGK